MREDIKQLTRVTWLEDFSHFYRLHILSKFCTYFCILYLNSHLSLLIILYDDSLMFVEPSPWENAVRDI